MRYEYECTKDNEEHYKVKDEAIRKEKVQGGGRDGRDEGG